MLLFVTALVLPILLVFAGMANDLAVLTTVDDGIQRSLDAAALAGAGNLGFSSNNFSAARSAAQQYAALNPSRVGAIFLNANTSNAVNGDILTGIWDGSSFNPSLDGTRVNAVLCRHQQNVPVSFLRLLGYSTLSASGYAIAVNAPAASAPEGCLFPLGIGSCAFTGNSSLGCGSQIAFIATGSGPGAGCLAPPCTTGVSWVSTVSSSAPTTPAIQNAIINAGSSACSSALQVGADLGTNNGMAAAAMTTLQSQFVAKWNASANIQVRDSNDNVVYSGRGWPVNIPLIQTSCPSGALSGAKTIVGWTQLIITQVINGGACAVPGACPPTVPSERALIGFISCSVLQSTTPTTGTGPRSSLSNHVKLVQ